MTTPAAFPAISVSEAYARLTGPGSPFEIEQREISGVRLRVWKNAPPTLREAFAAGRAFGGKTFLVHGEDRVSFEGFARAALNVATVLRDLGVAKGDRVAIAMRNLPEWPVAFFGAVLVGAIATPLNAWGTGPELEYGLTDSGAKVAFLDRERLERLFEHLHACPALVRVLVCREGEEVAHPLVGKLEDWIGEPNGWAGLPDRAFPRSISRRRTTRRCSTLRARRASRRARSARIAIPARRSWRGPSPWPSRICGAAKPRRRRIRTRRRSRCCFRFHFSIRRVARRF